MEKYFADDWRPDNSDLAHGHVFQGYTKYDENRSGKKTQQNDSRFFRPTNHKFTPNLPHPPRNMENKFRKNQTAHQNQQQFQMAFSRLFWLLFHLRWADHRRDDS